jgi:hypothetical protein
MLPNLILMFSAGWILGSFLSGKMRKWNLAAYGVLVLFVVYVVVSNA